MSGISYFSSQTDVPTEYTFGKFSIRRDFFLFCWITLATNLQNWNFKKKKKNLPNITAKLLVFSVIGNHFENYYFEMSLRFSKLCKNYDK